MKKICYISSSSLPSQSANSIHVINMVKSISKTYKVEVFARSSKFFHNKNKINQEIIKFYNLEKYPNIDLNLIYYPFPRFIELFITLYFLYKNLLNYSNIEKILSRNLFSSFVLCFIFNKIDKVYETHFPERGIRSLFQKIILFSNTSQIVVISQALKNILIKKYNLTAVQYDKIKIHHDAAPLENMEALANYDEFFEYIKVDKKNIIKFIGYFGNLYAGRGETLIRKLAILNPKFHFVIFGSKDFHHESITNLTYIKFIPPYKVIKMMKCVDILLMPYEKKVYLASKKNETSGWMSPIKMFEYLSSKVPFISSKIGVLEEVLKDEYNCILAEPDNVDDWNKKLNFLVSNPSLAEKISINGFQDFLIKYNWDIRSKNLILNKNISNLKDFIKYIVDKKIFSKGLSLFGKKIRIFPKFYIRGNFIFYVRKLFGGINFHNKNVLDIGSGNGIFSIYCSMSGAKTVVSLEPETQGSSDKMIETSLTLKNKYKCENVNFVNKKFEYYNNDLKFDVVLLHNTINHLDENATISLKNNETSQQKYIDILKFLRDKLNDDAEIIITDCSRYNFFGDLNIKNPFAPQIEWEKHNSPYLWKEMLTKAKFNSISVEWVNHNSLRSTGLLIFGNRFMSYFLNSYFLIKCKK